MRFLPFLATVLNSCDLREVQEMRITRVQKLWFKIGELKVILDENPHVSIEKARNLVKEMEQLTIVMRKSEIHRKRT